MKLTVALNSSTEKRYFSVLHFVSQELLGPANKKMINDRLKWIEIFFYPFPNILNSFSLD